MKLDIADLDNCLEDVVVCLDRGGIVLVPTDTVYGLAVHPERPEAVRRLYSMKGRPDVRNLPVMVSRISQIVALGGVLSPSARRLLDSELVPGPVTLALGIDCDKVVGWLRGRDEFAVRIPADQAMLKMLDRVGPLLVTSANLHSENTSESVAGVLVSLAGEPDIIIDGGRRSSVPSTLVNCRLEPPAIERVGAISCDDISKILGMRVALCH